MIEKILFEGGSLQTLKHALGVYADRGRVHARNVANAETPGYRSQQIEFEESLRFALRAKAGEGLKQTNSGHLSGGESLPAGKRTFRNPTSAYSGNGVNDVEIDREMADIAANTMRYTVAAEMVRRAYLGMKKAIHGRPVA